MSADRLSHVPYFLTRRTLLSGTATAAAAALLAGCGTSGSSSATGGGKLTKIKVGVPTDVTPADLTRTVSANSAVQGLVFDYLLGADLATGAATPSVATSWAWDSAMTTLTVQLRDDVRYHTGRAFTSADAIFALQLASDTKKSGSQAGALGAKIASMTAQGPYAFTIRLTSPESNFLYLLQAFPLVDSKTLIGLGSGRVIGTGPFRWGTWNPGNYLTLGKNKDYWQEGKPILDSVELVVYAESEALTNALEADEIQLAWTVTPESAQVLTKHQSYTIVSNEPQFTDYYVGVNVTAAPFTDVRLRQAVGFALDRQRIASQVLGSYGSASDLPWSSSTPGLTTADGAYYSYDPARSRALFTAAGSPAAAVPLVGLAGNPVLESILSIVEYNLTQTGFKVSAQLLQSTAYQAQLQAAVVKGLWVGQMGGMGGITAALLGNAPVKVGGNSSNFTDPVYEQLAGKVINAATSAQLAAANQALTSYMLQQAFHLTVAHGYQVSLAARDLTGAQTNLMNALVLTDAA